MGLSQAAPSQHLAKLRESALVATRRDAQTIYYRIDDARTEAIMDALHEIFCRPESSAARSDLIVSDESTSARRANKTILTSH